MPSDDIDTSKTDLLKRARSALLSAYVDNPHDLDKPERKRAIANLVNEISALLLAEHMMDSDRSF
jgi:hypothetical protein